MTKKEKRIKESYSVLTDLGMPRQQLNERSALCLLALLNLKPAKLWKESESPLVGITPIMDWAKAHYGVKYAPNTRETFRRQSMHQFIEAGICVCNPDRTDRSVNSPQTVYQIEPKLLELLKEVGTDVYADRLRLYLVSRPTLIERYAKAREMSRVPVRIKDDQEIQLSAGAHSELIKSIVEEFGARYAPGGELLYVGDTGDKNVFLDEELLASLQVKLDSHGKMPDVAIYLRGNNWLILIESVTSHGPVDAKRHGELSHLFKNCTAGLVYVSAFPNRRVFLNYAEQIAWESDVWIADAPSHLIHFNGVRFLGPYLQQ